jgi:hypothetical protein
MHSSFIEKNGSDFQEQAPDASAVNPEKEEGELVLLTSQQLIKVTYGSPSPIYPLMSAILTKKGPTSLRRFEETKRS